MAGVEVVVAAVGIVGVAACLASKDSNFFWIVSTCRRVWVVWASEWARMSPTNSSIWPCIFFSMDVKCRRISLSCRLKRSS